MVGVSHRVSRPVSHPLRGRSRQDVSLQEGRTTRPRRARDAPPRGPMGDRRRRACLVIGGLSAAGAWTWPGGCPEADPVAVLVRSHTPTVYAAVVGWDDVASGVGRAAGRAMCRQPVADLVRPDGRPSRAPVEPSGVATFAHVRRPGPRHRRGASSGPRGRESDPRMVDDPRAWTLYRRGDFRRGWLRVNIHAVDRERSVERRSQTADR